MESQVGKISDSMQRAQASGNVWPGPDKRIFAQASRQTDGSSRLHASI